MRERRARGGRRVRLRVKSVDRVERTGPSTYRAEVTLQEESDRPRRSGGKHPVEGHWEIRDGKRCWVGEHEARDPRR